MKALKALKKMHLANLANLISYSLYTRQQMTKRHIFTSYLGRFDWWPLSLFISNRFVKH